jgi:hypothetical protein
MIIGQALKLGLEGIVPKRLSPSCRSGPFARLDQGHEPGDDPGAGSGVVTRLEQPEEAHDNRCRRGRDPKRNRGCDRRAR